MHISAGMILICFSLHESFFFHHAKQCLEAFLLAFLKGSGVLKPCWASLQERGGKPGRKTPIYITKYLGDLGSQTSPNYSWQLWLLRLVNYSDSYSNEHTL